MDITMIGIDIAKNVFQLCGVTAQGKIMLEKRLTRRKLLPFMSQTKPCVVVMEACSGSSYWSRQLSGLGHEVKLISPQFVKPFVKSNKNDSNDAYAITEAASRAEMRFVCAKNVEQQDWQSLLRVREGAIEMRTKLCNQIRGLMREYGVVVPTGIQKLRKALPDLCDRVVDNGLTLLLKELIESQYNLLLILDQRIAECDVLLSEISQNSELCRRLMSIPGIGVQTAVALIATIGNGSAFKNGRHLSAFLGLVPRQHSSGDRQRLLGISKRGDIYLRKLFIHGARSALYYADKKEDALSCWATGIAERSHVNKACVALANKNARIALALLKTGESYRCF